MREERPTILDLVTAVRDFLDEQVRPELDGRLAFHTRVAVNVLGLVARELETGDRLDHDERRGLQQLLGETAVARQLDSADSSVSELNRELSRHIRAGDLDPQSEQLLRHLRQIIDRKLAIDNPKYRPVNE